jgi:hypothetical protein
MDDGRDRYQRSVEAEIARLRTIINRWEPVVDAAKSWTYEHYPEQYDALHEAVDGLRTAEDADND